MVTVRVNDVTLKQTSAKDLSFREKVELVRILDRMQADVIELNRIENVKADSLFIKTVCDAAGYSTVAVETNLTEESIDLAAQALKGAKQARLQVAAPVSLVQMEYLSHRKPEKLQLEAAAAVAYACTLCEDVEFLAIDAARSERAFLYAILEDVINAGARVVTVCDTAGELLPDEASGLIQDILANVPSIKNAVLGFSCGNSLAMADACTFAAVCAGAGEVKGSIYPEDTANVKNLAALLNKKGKEKGIGSDLRTVEIRRLSEQAARMFTDTRSSTTPFETGVREDISGRYFTIHDDISAIVRETQRLGYDLSEQDQVIVYDEFRKIAEKKEKVTAGEIDVIVASNALQVPPLYRIADYIVTSNSRFASTAHIRLYKGDQIMESVALGDGPVDACFLAIEQIIGRHYELDDFQIQAVTEGREAMGAALVKLRSMGRIFAGRGISTDIVGAAVSAYVSALNRIVYEGDEK